MRNLLLSAALIAAPVVVFAAGYMLLTPAAAPVAAAAAAPTPAAATLGDMAAFAAIVTDVQAIAATGDLAAAEIRITDLETAWDQAQPALRPVNPTAWGNVDGALDDALTALRSRSPNPANVDQTLVGLQTALADPMRGQGAVASAAPTTASGIVTTDANGRALPCEVMLDAFRTTLASATLTDANRATVDALQVKGTERCNADDDKRADDFFAQGLALMSN